MFLSLNPYTLYAGEALSLHPETFTDLRALQDLSLSTSVTLTVDGSKSRKFFSFVPYTKYRQCAVSSPGDICRLARSARPLAVYQRYPDG